MNLLKENHRLIKTGEAQLIENAEDIAKCFQDLIGGCMKATTLAREKVVLDADEENYWHRYPFGIYHSMKLPD